MKLIILLIFIALPIAELALLIEVGGLIGVLPTVALVILTAVIGIALLKRQGLSTLARARRAIDAGEAPLDSVIEGICLLLAGGLLVAPGLITDTFGFLLLIPPLRHAIGRWMAARMMQGGSIRVWTADAASPGRGRDGGRGGAPGTIEGEYEDVTPDEGEKRADKRLPPRGSDPDSPWRK